MRYSRVVIGFQLGLFLNNLRLHIHSTNKDLLLILPKDLVLVISGNWMEFHAGMLLLH